MTITMTMDAAPASPCIAVCVLDEDDICQGCYRSAGEITAWGELDAQGKQDVLNSARERRRQDGALL